MIAPRLDSHLTNQYGRFDQLVQLYPVIWVNAAESATTLHLDTDVIKKIRRAQYLYQEKEFTYAPRGIFAHTRTMRYGCSQTGIYCVVPSYMKTITDWATESLATAKNAIKDCFNEYSTLSPEKDVPRIRSYLLYTCNPDIVHGGGKQFIDWDPEPELVDRLTISFGSNFSNAQEVQ